MVNFEISVLLTLLDQVQPRLKNALKKMKLCKSVGVDDIAIGVLKV